MKYLVIGDVHINDKNIEELKEVFQEIIELSEIDRTLVILGDYYDKYKTPPTATELNYGTMQIKTLANYFKEVIVLEGNHQEFRTVNGIRYLENLGDVRVVSESYVENNIYFGHQMTELSLMNFGETEGKYFINYGELKQYKMAILGHQHLFQKIDESVMHLGSLIRNTFTEVKQKESYVLFIDGDTSVLRALKSPMPMYSYDSITCLKQAENGFKSKIRVCISDYSEYKSNLEYLNRQKSKYHLFVPELRFTHIMVDSNEGNGAIKNDSEIACTFLKSIEDSDIEEIIRREMVKEGLINGN